MSDQPTKSTEMPGLRKAVTTGYFAKRAEQYDKAIIAAKKIFEEKNAQYGDSITVTGVLGASVSLMKYAARVKQLVIKDPSSGEAHRDDLVEIFKDQINYAVIALIMLSEGNWDGE